MGYSFEPSIQNSVFNPDQLIAGSFEIVTSPVTVASGYNLTRGTVLGMVTSTGYYIPSIKTASDGSQVANAILAEDTNTSSSGTNAATPAPAYFAGEFDTNYMTIDASWTIATLAPVLRDVQIILKTGLSNAIV